MDARTTTGQAGLQVGADGRLAGLAERLDDHVGWASRFGMLDRWEVFRCELHAALTLALRLDGEAVHTRTTSSRWPGSASSTTTST